MLTIRMLHPHQITFTISLHRFSSSRIVVIIIPGRVQHNSNIMRHIMENRHITILIRAGNNRSIIIIPSNIIQFNRTVGQHIQKIIDLINHL